MVDINALGTVGTVGTDEIVGMAAQFGALDAMGMAVDEMLYALPVTTPQST